MRDAREERRPSDPHTESNVTEHGRTSSSSSSTRSKPNPTQDGARTHQLREISPPPLKRKRTAGELSHRGQDPLGVTDISTLKSLHDQPALSKHTHSNRNSFTGPSQTLHSFQASSVPHAHQGRIHNVSSLRKIPCPSKQSKPDLSCRPVCRVCCKTTTTSYNPIIACPECAKLYHDSCRRPPLIQGVDPQRWRCSACASDSRKLAKSMSSTSVPVRHSVVRDIFKPRHARREAVDSSRLSDETVPSEHVHNQTARASTTGTRGLESLDRPKEAFEPSLQTEPKLFDRSEILSTPTHCSSQPDRLESSFQQRHVQAQVGSPAPSSSVQVQISTPSTAMCSVCQRQSILRRPGDEDPQCRACQSKSRFEKMGPLEIPETPDAAAPYRIVSVASSAGSTALAALHSPATEAESSSWLDPNRRSNLDHASIPSSHNAQQREKAGQKLLVASETAQDDEPPACVSPVTHGREAEIHFSSRQAHPPATDETTAQRSYSKQRESENTNLKGSFDATSQLVPVTISTNPDVSDTNSSIRPRRHTNRELARMALACADGSSMSAPQIIAWLVQRFPCLEQGKTWEKSFRACLSLKEFRSHKADGLDEARVVYTFANEADKTRYKEEYRGYSTKCPLGDKQQQAARCSAEVESSGASSEIVDSMPEQGSRGDTRGACESPPMENSQSTRKKTPKDAAFLHPSAAPSTMLCASFIPSPTSTSSNGHISPSPFQLSEFPSARHTGEYVFGVKRETSFHKAYPRSTHPSIETMTAEEKAMKVAEIRARPSRKQLLDSGQRLAHVRRYRRHDIHDESDGAWKPQSDELKETPGEDGGAARDCHEPQSLREVFGLPANAVPMLNDGNELAFRDGTMVSEPSATLADRHANEMSLEGFLVLDQVTA